MKKIALVTATVIALVSASTAFARDPIKSAIHARKAAFTLIAKNFGPMGAMTKGKIPFNKDEFTLRAANLEALSTMPWEFFIPDSEKGSESKPAVWSNAEDYKAKANDFQKEAAALVKVSKGGDEKAMGIQFGKVAQTCKACHKEYKRK